MDKVVIDPEPSIVATGIVRKTPSSWRSVPNPLTGQVPTWQIGMAALRYADDHVYTIVKGGSISGHHVFIDSHAGSYYFFAEHCFLFIQAAGGILYLKFFKCVGHAKGEGAALLYFAMVYLIKTLGNISSFMIVLEPDYKISELGQFAGTNDERNKKLVAYYTKLGFTPVDEAKATGFYKMKFNAGKPPMESNVKKFMESLIGARAGGKRNRLKTLKKTKRAFKDFFQSKE